jgi:hypothetical protein
MRLPARRCRASAETSSTRWVDGRLPNAARPVAIRIPFRYGGHNAVFGAASKLAGEVGMFSQTLPRLAISVGWISDFLQLNSCLWMVRSQQSNEIVNGKHYHYLVICAAFALSFPFKAEAETSAAQIGPSFQCPAPRDPLAQLICLTPALSRLDLEFVQTYQSLRQQVGQAGQQAVRLEAVNFGMAVRSKCSISFAQSPGSSGPLPTPAPPESENCVAKEYNAQKAIWQSRLSGAALEEGKRPVEDQIALQLALQKLGFIPQNAKIDGVFGPQTRAAIVAWQSSNNRPQTGFLGDADGQILAPNVPVQPPVQAAAPLPGASPPDAAVSPDLIRLVCLGSGPPAYLDIDATHKTVELNAGEKNQFSEGISNHKYVIGLVHTVILGLNYRDYVEITADKILFGAKYVSKHNLFDDYIASGMPFWGFELDRYTGTLSGADYNASCRPRPSERKF